MTARTLFIAFDNENTDTTVLTNRATSKASRFQRGEVVYVNATFFENGVIRPDFIGVTYIHCDIIAVGETAYLARVTVPVASVTVRSNAQFLTGLYNCQFEFEASATQVVDPAPLGHDTFRMVAWADTTDGPVDFGQGLFTCYGTESIATSSNAAFDPIYLKDQDGNTFPVRVNTENGGKTVEAGDQI